MPCHGGGDAAQVEIAVLHGVWIDRQVKVHV